MEKFIYEAPAVETLELAAEGCYCLNSSTNGQHGDWNQDNDLWS